VGMPDSVRFCIHTELIGAATDRFWASRGHSEGLVPMPAPYAAGQVSYWDGEHNHGEWDGPLQHFDLWD